jgi:hypothetical protein
VPGVAARVLAKADERSVNVFDFILQRLGIHSCAAAGEMPT